MKRILIAMFVSCVSAAAVADVTLQCDVGTHCDGYLQNCITDPYSFAVNVDPKNGTVTVGSSQIKADFSNPAEVVFTYQKYKYVLNRYEYSAILVTKDDVRHGWCKKIDPAW
jgi:hypothetical protein